MNTEPKNLEDCITILKENTSKDVMEKLKNGTITTSSVHHTLGRYIRNSWNLWGDSELKEWFKKMGIWHPDDMSGIIMDSFVLYLKGEPINLDEQVKFYQDYWKKMETKPKSMMLQFIKGKWVQI